MKRPIYQSEAREDLKEIRAYVSRENKKAARELMRGIKTRCELVASVPGIGEGRDNLLPGMRSLPSGAYLIFYVAGPGRVEIVRVVHGSRDIDSIFK